MKILIHACKDRKQDLQTRSLQELVESLEMLTKKPYRSFFLIEFFCYIFLSNVPFLTHSFL